VVPPYARQVRLSGPVNIDIGAELAQREAGLISVELRDRDGNPFQHSVARIAWADLTKDDGLPGLLLDLDLCLSVAPPADDLSEQSKRISKTVRERKPNPRRLPREELIARNRKILADLSDGVSYREAGLRYGLAHSTVVKIAQQARDAQS
jgi:hypothetical protein